MSAIVETVINHFSNLCQTYKIKDIAEIGRGRVISSKEISSQVNPRYPVFSSQTSNEGIMGYLDDYMFDGEYITWTTDGANAGTIFYRNGKFNCTNVCGILKLKDNFDAYFVSHMLQKETRSYVSINLANPKLMNNTMSQIEVKLPTYKVQVNVSKMFRSIDLKIKKMQKLYSHYNIQKQYLLSKMFI